MASNRKRSQRSSGLQSSAVKVYPPSATASPKAPGEPVEAKSSKEMAWQVEYAYIGKDLRQLGIVSGVLFALLLIGGLFI
jgi:hypothetical protein